jgi:uncharacterized iron-regulated protein
MRYFNFLAVILLLLSTYSVLAQHKKAYQIFTKEGVQTDFYEVLDKAKQSEIILFGEQHNSAIAHWLQFELTSALIESSEIKLGAEMFERDNQDALTAYIKGEIDQKGLDTLARLWSNYKTDYAPLVNLAKQNNIEFVATNIPRRYANLVFRNGFSVLDTLSKEAKSWIAPLPIAFDPELPTYKNILTMMGDHGTPELVKAQAIKDATMAYSILEHRNENGNEIFIHYNGAYHSDFYEGILWYLKLKEPDLKYFVISTVTQKDINILEDEHKGKADFIIVVDQNVTTTY